MVEYFDGTPDPSMMPKSGKTGYSFSQSISELVDNSLDERISKEKLVVDIKIGADNIEVIDNAKGMDKDKLKTAMILAKANKEKNKLGIYGLGLKTSCVNLGNYFEVISKNGTNQTYKTWWDKVEWENKKDWKFPITKSDEELEKSGTIVRVKDLRIKTGNKINRLRADLGRRFAPFIDQGVVEIKVNNKKCKAMLPKIIPKTKEGIVIKTKYGVITGWVALLKSSSQGGKYGFRTFRNGRMITYNDKFGFSPHPTLARLVGELHLNYVPVTTDKRGWEVESEEYVDAERQVAKALKDIKSKARQKYHEKKISKKDKNTLELFKEGLQTAISATELKDFTLPERTVSGSSGGKTSGRKITSRTKVEVEKRNPGKQKGTVEPQDTGRKRKPISTHIVTRNRIKIRGKLFDYEHKFSKAGEDGPIYDFTFDKKHRKLEIYTNKEFPAAEVSRDLAFYAFTNIVESIAKVMIQEAGEDWNKFEDIKRVLLSKSSEYVSSLKKPAS